MNKRFFHLIIVDESGSMDCITKQTISGINETIQSVQHNQREHEGQEHFITLTTFSSDRIQIIYDATPAMEAELITAGQYEPSGCTPLYDAVGRSIQQLRRSVAPADSVFVTIITDGYENASKEFNHTQIRALIEEQKKLDWVFAFIGANIDVEQESTGLGISFCMRFEQDEKGTTESFRRLNKVRAKASKYLAEHADACLSSCVQEEDFE